MLIATKNAVAVKNTPNFSRACAVTKKLEDLMNWLTKKEAKASKIARESKWKAAGSDFT